MRTVNYMMHITARNVAVGKKINALKVIVIFAAKIKSITRNEKTQIEPLREAEKTKVVITTTKQENTPPTIGATH